MVMVMVCRTCSVHGGDGFAFVLHWAPEGVGAIGRGDSQVGYYMHLG
jgi:hypothetical protein